MKDEIQAACRWILENISIAELSAESLACFEENLNKMLEHRFQDHWYAADPLRGQAFRSLVVDEFVVDNILIDAGRNAGINDVQRRLKKNWRMWIDPCEVEVKFEITNQRTLLYKKERSNMKASAQPWQSSVNHKVFNSPQHYQQKTILRREDTNGMWVQDEHNEYPYRAPSPPRKTFISSLA
eukprot:TRINITY_DN818_c0_g1_i4.p1 TRINITY_DN818_c0_g1~~TRINITY_DN818_c0_g1_i4.p1  ORF type:complete len:183 (-),score=32.05 TRINITY_DN818_c0_g1_i4:142-690(-)